MPQRFDGERRNALALKISRRCPVGCEFCCDPRDFDTNKLTVEEMSRWIAEAMDAVPNLLGIVSFTGGDPFVHVEDILRVGRVSAGYGLDMALITSAYWASSYDKARRILERLREVRLARFSLSADPSHQVRVPIQNVKNALKAAMDLGLVGHVVGTFESTADRVEAYLGMPAPAGYIFLSKVVAPYGWASSRDLTVTDYGITPDLSGWRCYRVHGHDILVQPNGDVLPCCSTTNTVNPLKLGNLREGDSIGDIVKMVVGSFLLRVLKHDGFAPEGSYDEAFPGQPSDVAGSGRCVWSVWVLRQGFSEPGTRRSRRAGARNGAAGVPRELPPHARRGRRGTRRRCQVERAPPSSPRRPASAQKG
jgi:MoaA/NifB/PqqE/SkfB family radical SAM enzyme